MTEYIVRRLIMTVPILIGISILVFAGMRMIPGELAVMLAGGQDATAEDVERMRRQLNLDRPLHEQYGAWFMKAVQGDFGKSAYTKRPVLEEIGPRVPVSLELGLLAVIISFIMAIPLGVLSAVRQDTAADYTSRLVSIVGLCAPSFWVATLMITLPSVWFRWAPATKYVPLFDNAYANFQIMILPALALAFPMSASVMRMTRSCMLEVFRQDYIRTAWAKGLRERVVIYRHALKNAMIPVITIVGLQLGLAIGGTVIMESIFVLPGMGKLMFDSLRMRDYSVVQAVVLMMATAFVLINLLVDLTYAWLDPRIRYR